MIMKTILISIFILGCDEAGGLIIDSDFTPSEFSVIETAIADLNEAAGDEVVYVLRRKKDVKHLWKNSEESVMIRFSECGNGKAGEMHGNDIAICIANFPAAGLPLVAMHELGHLIGLDHSDNMDDIMYPTMERLQYRTGYSTGDIEQMKLLFN